MVSDLSGTRVLVVDDEPYFCKLMQRLLTSMGYTSETAGDGALALEKTQEFQPSVLFLDFNLPDTTGPELAAKIRLITPGTVIIGFSGHAEAEVQRHLANATFDFFYQKPMNLPELRLILAKALLEAGNILKGNGVRVGEARI